ncbi:hypothetical protein ABIC83_002909 [Roseateles asaccharophilus]|uniref:hypothetical protein n=1 Tax=Roseateles asaccharophilus TaxID=582607 RepID=UPI003838ABAC
MNLPLVSLLVEKQNFQLLCWDDNYGKGIWAVCMPWLRQAQDVNDAAEAGDSEMIPATEYLQECEWLPAVTGETLLAALQRLEDRLASIGEAQMHRQSDWTSAVCAAMEHMDDVQKAAEKRNGFTDGHYRPLPKDFMVVARAAAHQHKHGGEVTW